MVCPVCFTASPTMTDLLSASLMSEGSVASYLTSFFAGQAAAASSPLAPSLKVNSSPNKPARSSPVEPLPAPYQLPLYRYLKQQLHLPERLELYIGDSDGHKSTVNNNSANSGSEISGDQPHQQQHQPRLGISVAVDLPHSTTFGPYSAKISKSRLQLTHSDLCLKVCVAPLTHSVGRRVHRRCSSGRGTCPLDSI